MSEHPRPILDDKHPVDWVQRRASCTDAVVFTWLYDQVRTDVESANKIRNKNQGRVFSVMGNAAKGRFAVCHGNEADIQDATVEFNLSDEKIEIDCGPRVHHVVTRAWNFESASCVLQLDRDPMELWEISQNVLYGAFFGGDDDQG